MSNAEFLVGIARALVDVIRPLEQSLHTADAFETLLTRYGWQVPEERTYLTEIQTIFGLTADLKAVVDLIADIEASEYPSLEDAVKLTERAVDLVERLQRLAAASPSSALPFPLSERTFWQSFASDLAQDLVAEYLELLHPPLFGPLHLLGIIDETYVPANGAPGRIDYARTEIRWDRLGMMVTDPGGLAKDVYGWGETFLHAKFILRLQRAMRSFGLRAARYKPFHELLGEYYESSNSSLETVEELRVPFYIDRDPALGYVEFGLALLPVPPKSDRNALPSGFLLGPYLIGNSAQEISLGGAFMLRLRGGLDTDSPVGIEVRPEGVGANVNTSSTTLDLGMALVGRPNFPWIVIGSEFSSRLQLSDVTIGVDVIGAAEDPELKFIVSTSKLEFILDLADGDGFLQKIIGDGQQTLEFAGGVVWSSKRGLTFQGQGSLDATIGVRRKVGFVYIDSLFLGIGAENGNVAISVAASGNVKLGPLTVTVDRVGLRLMLEPRTGDERPGNFGMLNLDFGFKPPNGVGLALDAGPIVGGGYLFFDGVKEEYAGVLQLEFEEKLTLTAIGLLTTRLPDGSKGFSLLIIISAQGFAPIQLGYGFTLNGVGGLVGVNRTVVVDVLRAGIKAGTLDSVLFPEDPVRNAPQIISNLRAVFPPAENRYVLGPMAILGWGTPTQVTVELALIIEFPAPLRLVILGQVRAFLPDPFAALIQLQMDALGIIDFDRRDVSVDATLFDSHLAQYVLSGDMALRANWGASPTFIVAVGGLHPRFQPPPNFPALDRVAVSLGTGDNPRLRLEGYLALTANTAQFGARLDLYASGGGFSIEGSLGFDALFQFTPFHFIADVNGRVVVRQGSHKITSLELDMSLTGPAPWHARGKATFKVAYVKYSVRFNREFGQAADPELPPAVNVGDLLIAAVGDARNWAGELAGGHALVSIRPTSEAGGLVHPHSVLTFRQRVVPLGLTISRFGNNTLGGDNRFVLRDVMLNGRPVKPTPVNEAFAPAQFFELSDDEKLSRPSFESLEAGIRLEQDPVCGTELPTPIEYESIILDPLKAAPAEPADPYPLPAGHLAGLARIGAAGHAVLRRTGRSKFRAPGRRVSVREPSYVVATIDSLTSEPIPGLPPGEGMSYTKATEVLGAFLAAHPERRGMLQVVRELTA